MKANSTQSAAVRSLPADAVAKPLTELTSKQKQRVTTELQRIHSLVSSLEDSGAHKDRCADKADRACAIEFKPKRA